MIYRITLSIVAFLLLSAHFLRGDHLFLTAACLLAPSLLSIRKRWAGLALQWMLYAGAAVWLYTAYALAQQRLAAQQPLARMLVVLLAVAAVAFTSGWVMTSRTQQNAE